MAKALKVKKISPADAATRAGARILRTRLKEFYSRWRNPEQMLTPEQFHDLRISGKRLRYSAEALRTLYPDRLALLIELLKRLQETLGEMQDCETQRAAVEEELKRRGRRGEIDEIVTLRALIGDYESRQRKLTEEFALLWRGLSRKKFRAGLKELVSRPRGPGGQSFAVDQTRHEPGAEAVVDVDNRDVSRA